MGVGEEKVGGWRLQERREGKERGRYVNLLSQRSYPSAVKYLMGSPRPKL